MARARSTMLKRFGSVTVLNGHIHQIMQKVEGNVTFHTARSTAFPQPAPGTAPSPGPMKVADDKLRSLLGITNVTFKRGRATARHHRHAAAGLNGPDHDDRKNIARGGASVALLRSRRLRSRLSASRGADVKIDNFAFAPER